MSLQFSAPAGVKSAGHKKQRDDGDENKVNHRFCFHVAGPGSGSAADAATQLFGLRRESRRAEATPLLQRGAASQSGVAAALCHRTPKSSRHFVRSFGNPGCCGWDTRAPFHLGTRPADSPDVLWADAFYLRLPEQWASFGA